MPIFRPLNMEQLSRVADKLPENWDKFVVPIPAVEGVAFRVTSFTDDSQSYRCAILDKGEGWMGKCECIGWPRTKAEAGLKTPCKHIAAALLCNGGLTQEVKNEVPKNVPSSEAGSNKPEVSTPVAPLDQDRESAEPDPFLDAVPDASPLTRSAAVVPIDPEASALVAPVADIQEVRAVFKAFQDAKFALLDKHDVQGAGSKNFIKKSGWRKIAVFFGLSCQKIAEGWTPGTGKRVWFVTYRAIARNGTFQDGTGFCSWDEAACVGRAKKGKEGEAKNEHDVRTTAETRAKNRAISDLVGGGEVSAEEMRMVGSWKNDG